MSKEELSQGRVACKTLCELCVVRGYNMCANTAKTTPIPCPQPQRKPLMDETCTWARPDSNHMPDTWEAACGAMWTFTEGGPKDNDMHFCPKCGKPALEAAHGIKGDA